MNNFNTNLACILLQFIISVRTCRAQNTGSSNPDPGPRGNWRNNYFSMRWSLSLSLYPLANRYLSTLSVFSFYKYTYIYVSYLYYIHTCIFHLFQDESVKPSSERAFSATATGGNQVPIELRALWSSQWIKLFSGSGPTIPDKGARKKNRRLSSEFVNH